MPHQLISLYELAAAPMLLPAISFAKWVESFNAIFELLANKTFELPAHVHISQIVRYLLSSLGISLAHSTHSKKRDRYLEDAIRYMTEHLTDSIKLPEFSSIYRCFQAAFNSYF